MTISFIWCLLQACNFLRGGSLHVQYPLDQNILHLLIFLVPLTSNVCKFVSMIAGYANYFIEQTPTVLYK